MNHAADSDVAEVIAAELSLLTHEVRSDAALLDQYLADDFEEIGKSGRLWSRVEMISAMLDESDDETIRAEELTGRVISADLVLVRYVSNSSTGVARRSSVWRREGRRWRVVFHQGTRIG
jgi:hypothetical protein